MNSRRVVLLRLLPAMLAVTATVQGVALAQVLPGAKLKFEAFPGFTAAQVSGFTAAAKLYER